MELLKIFLPFFFIAFSFGEIARIQFPNSVGVGLFDIAVVLLSALYFKKFWRKNYFLKIPILFFIIVSVFSLLINFSNFESNQIVVGSLYLVRWVAYTGIYFAASSLSQKGRSYTLKFMTLSGIFIVLIGYLQLFFYPNLKNLYYLGWDEHMYRMFSSFLDPNFAGVIFVLFFVFFFIFRDRLIPDEKIIQSFILASTFGAIILTYSRGAILMLLVCIIIYSAITKKWVFTAGIVTLFILIFIILSPMFYIENINLLRFASVEARIDSSKKALEIFQKNPMGVGFNTYRFVRQRYEETDWSGAGPSHSGAGVDNSLILILVTTGVAGLTSYLYLLYKIFKLGFLKLSKVEKGNMGLVLIVSVGGLLVNSLFINSLLYSFAMAWIFLIAGLTESSSRG